MCPITGIPAPTIAADAGEHRARALELDGVGARLLDEADRVPDGVLVGDLERAERHVGDHERPARAARDRAGEDEHLLHRRRDGRVVAEHGHRGRVADEHEVGARLVGEAAAGRVVRGHHHDRLAPRLHLRELGDRELPGRGRVRARVCCGRVLMRFSFEDDVVDQAGGADADGAGEDGRIEVGDLDVVDVEAVRRCEERARGLADRASRAREGARALRSRSSAERRALRDESASPSASRTVGSDAQLDLEREVADQSPEHLDLLGVLLAEVGTRRAGRW